MADRLQTEWAPRILSIVRIVAALIFMEHGTSKLLGFPSGGFSPEAFSLPWIAGVLELVGGALLVGGLFSRPTAFVPLEATRTTSAGTGGSASAWR